MFCVGLTGGIASGKTTVASLFIELGAGLVDTDEVAREVVAVGEPGLDAVIETFGTEFLLGTGGLDRDALRTLVFRDAEARRRLETLLHPLIRSRTRDQLASLRTPYAVAVVPLLVETDFGELVDRVLVVDCPRELQLERVIQRDRISAEEAEVILEAQASRETRAAQADDLLDTSQSLSTTRNRVKVLHSDYLRRAAAHDEAD